VLRFVSVAVYCVISFSGGVVVGAYLDADTSFVKALCSFFDEPDEDQVGWLCPTFDEQ
jgi:hypothetical protein